MFELWWVRFFLLWIGHPTQISWPLGTLREQTCWQWPHHSTKFQLKQTNHQSNPLAISSLVYQIKLLWNQSSFLIHLQETFNLPITTNTHTASFQQDELFWDHHETWEASASKHSTALWIWIQNALWNRVSCTFKLFTY